MDLLQVRGKEIVTQDNKEIKLRGVNIGAWMNMENFLNGYPGSESALRHEFAQKLGEEKAAFFFDRLLSHMFAEEDIIFLKSLGMNVVRLPLNYHHFESDMQPFVYKEAGFERLDRALQWCEKHGMYAILDMHTAPGFQGPDWHSDNSSQRSFFWDHIQFQDRFVALWEALARRYKNRAVVAGYDLLNEPISNSLHGRFPSAYHSEWDKINSVYRRTVEAIRRIDSDHIIYLEGDYLGFYFEGFEPPFTDNLVYSSHLYPAAAVKEGVYPSVIDGEMWDKEKLRQSFIQSEGLAFSQKYNVPLWLGEFGTSYIHPEEQQSRVQVLADMIEVFEEYGAHWTIWTYKDIGNMGLLQTDPDSEYASKVIPILDKERLFIRSAGRGRKLLAELADYMQDIVGDPNIDADLNQYFLEMSVRENYLQLLLLPSYVRLFESMTFDEIDQVLAAFSVDRCVRHPALEAVKKFL